MKLFKALAAFFFVFGLFAATGCTSQSFCSEQDINNISEKIVEKLGTKDWKSLVKSNLFIKYFLSAKKLLLKSSYFFINTIDF